MLYTVVYPAATVYPDSDKIGIWTGNKDDDLMVRRNSGVEYYEGEAGGGRRHRGGDVKKGGRPFRPPARHRLRRAVLSQLEMSERREPARPLCRASLRWAARCRRCR